MSGAHGLELKINLKILVTISSPLSILYPLLALLSMMQQSMLLIFFSIGLKLRSPHIIGTVKLLPCGVQSSLRGPRTLVSSPSHQSITSKWVLNRGTELRSSSKRRDGGRSSRVFVDYYEDQSSRKGVRDSSPMYDDKQSSRRSRHRSRSMTREEDASDDERNFKRRWGRRSSAAVDTRR